MANEFNPTPMDVAGSYYTVNKKLAFHPMGELKPETVERIFEFAYNMTFGSVGEHRCYRTGGSHRRRKGEIFANTFQGKLAECAVYNTLYKVVDLSKPNLEEWGLGEWDDCDLSFDNKTICIKSTKAFGNLLLLESADWNEKGEYLPNAEQNAEAPDYHILVRMKPFCEDLMRQNRLMYTDQCDKAFLHKLIMSSKWSYDIPGFITNDDLIKVIKLKHIIHRGNMLNKFTKMDADNYYVQAGDFRELKYFE